MDTAPLLSVADTSVLMSLSDIRLLIVRHAFSKKGEIAQALQNSDQIGLNFDGLVYNAYESLRDIMAIISTMATTHINIMLKNTYQTVMIMKMNNKLLLPIFYYQFHLVPYLLG